MKHSTMYRIARRPLPVRLTMAVLSLALSNAVVLAQPEENSKSPATPKPGTTQTPTASPKPTPETKIDARTEAELLQAEDRFVIAIKNRDVKELEELLHPQFADSIQGRESAIIKRGFIPKASIGSLPAYRVEKERKLIRSGDLFTVEGLGKDIAHEMTEDNPSEHWASVRRFWVKEGGRWIATAQIIAPIEDNELRERLNPETKTKPPD
jgi:hypothetical protein